MKLSVVILTWNDLKVVANCLESIYVGTHSTEFEVIVSDNGSIDGSVDLIRKNYPQVRVIENAANLRFAKGNNVGINASRGEYILILNPDTIVHDGTLDKMVAYADRHPEAGAFGCMVLRSDGSYWQSGRPMYTLRTEWCSALGLGALSRISDFFATSSYVGWQGDSERTVGWLAGCFILCRAEVLKRVGGFDDQFFYFFEDTDLCRKIWEAGYTIRYAPEATIIHLGGQSTAKRFPPIGFALDGQVTRYRYFYKYYGAKGVRSARKAILVSLALRRLLFWAESLVKPNDELRKQMELYAQLFNWNLRVDPVRLVERGEEPTLQGVQMKRVMDR